MGFGLQSWLVTWRLPTLRPPLHGPAEMRAVCCHVGTTSLSNLSSFHLLLLSIACLRSGSLALPHSESTLGGQELPRWQHLKTWFCLAMPPFLYRP